ncbi:exopolysaccharide production repressor protein [Ciceribacter selenitireducens]
MMYAPRVFASMLGALIVFAIATYVLTGSIGTTLWQTAVAAVLLQLGYFVGVLVLVSRSARRKSQGASAVGETVKPDQNTAKSGPVPVSRLNAPEQPNL